MPIYEFECRQCKARFELLVRSSAAPMACPACKSADLARLISSFAFTSRDGSGATTASSTAGCSGCSGKDCSHCRG
ncbi:MAG: zinc ribbon domain-containing protein [Candidatus Omnitrophica bacterium]|nr:zinc ribbon domain-containing protein [Candidatus Omnitrophota bacterium]MDD5774665.1 zinc ribbon domain-containing protein [Candidatus Omnitrophota bacterium]